MFRIFVVAPIIFALLVPTAAHAALAQVYRGQVTSVHACYPSGYAFQVDESTTTLIFNTETTLAIPQGAIPTLGQSMYTIATTDATCDVDPGSGVTLASGRAVPYFAYTPRIPPTPSPTTTPPTNNQNNGSNSGSGTGSQFMNFLSGELKAVIGGLAQGATDKLMSALGLGGTTAPSGIPFGGMITTLFPCENGAIYTVLSPPTPGIYIWMPGTISYLHGPPSFVGQHLLGLATPPPTGICVMGTTVLTGFRIIMHGSSGPTLPDCPAGTQPTSAPPTLPAGGAFCDNAQWNQYAGDAIDKYGGNMMSGNVPGLTTYCPNYSSLSTDQRKAFWTKVAGGIWKGETDCNANSVNAGEDSNGLFQLTPGNAAIGHPGACPLTRANILDPKTNITCGIAIMDGLSKGGVTKNNSCTDGVVGTMSQYWTTLRTGQCQTGHNQDSSGNILANMANFPGCNGPATGSSAPSQPTTPTSPSTPSSAPANCVPVSAPASTQCNSLPSGGTPAQQAAAERSVRDQLQQCGVKITSSQTNGAPCAPGQNGLTAGCTNVGGLQCDAIANLCALQQSNKCGQIVIDGGSEPGHHTSSPGNAVDIVPTSAMTQCIEQNFTPGPNRTGCKAQSDGSPCVPYSFKTYKDPNGNVYVHETPTKGYNTGDHWHVCVAGKTC